MLFARARGRGSTGSSGTGESGGRRTMVRRLQTRRRRGSTRTTRAPVVMTTGRTVSAHSTRIAPYSMSTERKPIIKSTI
eukprot:205739-Rhodomonas_salina.1